MGVGRDREGRRGAGLTGHELARGREGAGSGGARRVRLAGVAQARPWEGASARPRRCRARGARRPRRRRARAGRPCGGR
jgi:hypothetical protein